jgi:phosphoserine phosphatase RsbU/P
VYDPHDRTFTFVNAGHNPPILCCHNGQLKLLITGGTVLGAFEHSTYEQETLTLTVGDVIFIYTDGVSEAMNAVGEELGEERLCDVVHNHAAQDVQTVLDEACRVLAQHQYDAHPEDDQTLLVAKVC